ncbi:MAG: hypothetical protein C0415_00445 [Thermodesulfovibrio sp.]|nr:hypothetical protein [Thermodesulfovibrio sp.]
MTFEVLDISGDIGIKASGKTCEEAFVNAGMGMYSLITDIGKIKDEKRMEIEVKADSPESLLVRYLNELIFQFDAYGFIGRGIKILDLRLMISNLKTEISNQQSSIKLKVFGEEFDSDRHEQGLLVKAATYHNIKIEKRNDECIIEVIFDI